MDINEPDLKLIEDSFIIVDYKENEEILEIEKEISLLTTMFLEIKKEVLKSELDDVSNYIKNIKENVDNSNQDIIDINNEINNSKTNSTYFTLVGVGIGSIIYFYNPLLSIGSSILGGFLGYNLSKVINYEIDYKNN